MDLRASEIGNYFVAERLLHYVRQELGKNDWQAGLQLYAR